MGCNQCHWIKPTDVIFFVAEQHRLRWASLLCFCRQQYMPRKALCIPVVRPSVRCPLRAILRDAISLLSEDASMKLGTNIHLVTGHCRKGFPGRRSKVKVIARLDALLRRRHTFRRCGVEAYVFMCNKHEESDWQLVRISIIYTYVRLYNYNACTRDKTELYPWPTLSTLTVTPTLSYRQREAWFEYKVV